MNLSLCKGKVPVFIGDQVQLVPFPERKEFDLMFKSNSKALREKYWNILKMRSEGHTLQSVGGTYTLTRERIRQIEARFLRKVATSLRTDSL